MVWTACFKSVDIVLLSIFLCIIIYLFFPKFSLTAFYSVEKLLDISIMLFLQRYNYLSISLVLTVRLILDVSVLWSSLCISSLVIPIFFKCSDVSIVLFCKGSDLPRKKHIQKHISNKFYFRINTKSLYNFADMLHFVTVVCQLRNIQQSQIELLCLITLYCALHCGQ